MSTFEELELAPELVEALAAEGVEVPSAIQRELVPLVRRGNNVVAVAGPGSGVLAACAAPLLERVEAEGDTPRILILTPTAERAEGLAESVGRLAQATGHRVAALDALWILPERAQVLVATPEAVRNRIAGGQLSLAAVEAVVVDGAGAMAVAGALDTAGAVLEGVPTGAQRVVVALPASPAVEAFAELHARRSVHVPSGAPAAASPHRGDLTVMETGEPREASALRAVARQLQESRHVLVYVRSEDAAADLGDHLSLRGYTAGRPGDPDVPVWLAVDALEARGALEGTDTGDVAVISIDVPPDADTLDQRHGLGGGGSILALPREVLHVKATAAAAGYAVAMGALPPVPDASGSLSALLASLDAAAGDEDVEAYQMVLEPLFQRHGAGAVAAAAVALLRSHKPVPQEEEAGSEKIPGYVRLFVSVGKRDNVRPGDLVGAITGEAGVNSDQVGRIDLRDSFCLVEVERSIAEKVIRALNGTSIRGRAARVDFHREDRHREGRPEGGPRGRREGRSGTRPEGRRGPPGGRRPDGRTPPDRGSGS
jgi:ATP-dependent RNA helicase DeaD